MEVRSVVEFFVEKNGRLYRFLIPAGSPFGEVYDAAFEVLGKVQQLAQDSLEKAKREEPQSENVAE